jgi:AAA domain
MSFDYNHEEFKRLGPPSDLAAWPQDARKQWWSANTAAILADSDALVGSGSLAGSIEEIGSWWNDPDFIAGASSAKHGNGQDTRSSGTIIAKPYVYRDPRTIPPRQFLHAGHYIRGFLSATIGPGGLGKTSLQLVEAVGMVIGRDLLKGIISSRQLNVWYWNLEDPQDETDRRVAPSCCTTGSIHQKSKDGYLSIAKSRLSLPQRLEIPL